MINLPKLPINLKDGQPQSMILIILVGALVAVLLAYFVLIPQLIRIVDVTGKILQMRSDLRSVRTDIEKLALLKKSLEESNAKVEAYEKRLPAEQEIPSLLENLSAMAKSSGVKIIGIMPAPSYFKDQKASSKNQIYKEIPIIITAKSGYHELGYFLSNLENADRFMKVVDVSIKANKTSPRKHDVELMVCTYILLPRE